jgi:hypothetical protein
LIPATSNQLLILVAVILPGVVFGTVLRRLRGPTPEDKDVGTQVLRATAVGIGLDIAYVLVAGPGLVNLLRGAGASPAFVRHPREAGLWALLLLGVIPAVLAYAVHAQAVLRDSPPNLTRAQLVRRVLHTTYRATPTAWDHIARRRGGCFVRVRLAEGDYVGGWVDGRAFVSGYPEPRDLFVASQWVLDQRGVFIHKIEGTLGFYLAICDGMLVEWIAAPNSAPADNRPPAE